ncbi:MAG: hypothetical protein E7812_02720 [Phenylobacterium sp.]|nr:MAG: hypothetical protein E7812_02720 [Phenylobacterium sp.]
MAWHTEQREDRGADWRDHKGLRHTPAGSRGLTLAQRIAAYFADGGIADLDLAIHGTADPDAIAAAIDAVCRETLGSGVAEGLFYAASLGAVAGVALADGRRVVVKAYQAETPPELLREIVRLRDRLRERGVAAPAGLAGPTPFGRGHAIIESLLDDGRIEDTHQPPFRRALARGLHDLIEVARPLATPEALYTYRELSKSGRLWRPPGKRFDFAATAAGAEYIDDVGRAARALIEQHLEAGELVIGHADWRAEHVRFVSQGETIRIAAIYDWDSLLKRREPALVGVAAGCFCANWAAPETVALAPTLDESRAFVADYEAARDRPFGREERHLLSGAFAYTVAHLARAGHALGRKREPPGTFNHLVWTEGVGLLEL